MDITQTIVQEIVSQCGRHGFVVSASLAHFYLKAQLLKDEKDAAKTVELSPERIEALVDKAVVNLTKSDCPSLETFKLQASVTTMKQEQLNRSRTEEIQHRAKTQQLIQEVCSKTDPNQVLSDMTLYVLHESRLFSSTNDLVQKETMTALESVIPRGSIAPFISQKLEDKAKQLDELWRIVWGIRLFNKESQKGGAGIPSLPTESEQLVKHAMSTCKQHLQEAEKLSFHYQVVLTTPSMQASNDGRQRLVEEYINRKQYWVYLKSILKLLEENQKRLTTIQPTWDELVVKIQEMVSHNSSVPKSHIYPKFIDISDAWDDFRSIWREISDGKKLLDLVVAYQSPYRSTLNPSDIEAALQTHAEEQIPNRALIQGEIQNPAITYFEELPDGAALEFNGFCIASLIDISLLVDGKKGTKSPGYLYLVSNSSYYAFSSERLLKAFARDPVKYLSQSLLDQCSAQSELTHLIGLQNELPKEIYLQGTRLNVAPKEVIKVDSHSQTGHIDSHRDHKYEWNEWELRRLALKVANLRSKKTHSSQTTLSHMRRDNDTQTFLPKTQDTQTMLSKATQPSKKVQYIKGLRGHPNQRVQVVKLEFNQ